MTILRASLQVGIAGVFSLTLSSSPAAWALAKPICTSPAVVSQPGGVLRPDFRAGVMAFLTQSGAGSGAMVRRPGPDGVFSTTDDTTEAVAPNLSNIANIQLIDSEKLVVLTYTGDVFMVQAGLDHVFGTADDTQTQVATSISASIDEPLVVSNDGILVAFDVDNDPNPYRFVYCDPNRASSAPGGCSSSTSYNVTLPPGTFSSWAQVVGFRSGTLLVAAINGENYSDVDAGTWVSLDGSTPATAYPTLPGKPLFVEAQAGFLFAKTRAPVGNQPRGAITIALASAPQTPTTLFAPTWNSLLQQQVYSFAVSMTPSSAGLNSALQLNSYDPVSHVSYDEVRVAKTIGGTYNSLSLPQGYRVAGYGGAKVQADGKFVAVPVMSPNQTSEVVVWVCN